MGNSTHWLPTFDKPAAASLFLHQALVSGGWFFWEWAERVQFVHAVHGALKEGLWVVDRADNSGQRWRGAAKALVDPGAVGPAVQLALDLSGQVAVGPVVQALHAVFVPVTCWCLDQTRERSRAVSAAFEHLPER